MCFVACALAALVALKIACRFACRRRFGCGHHPRGCGHGRFGHHRFGHGWRKGCGGPWGAFGGPDGCGPRGGGFDDYEDRARGFVDDDDGPADPGSRRGPFGFGRGMFAEAIFERLELTPSQRKAVKESLGELERALRGHRGELQKTREDLAKALRSDDFDVEILGELFARQDDVIGGVRKEVTGVLGKIHATLDDEQRARLARILERGFPWS